MNSVDMLFVNTPDVTELPGINDGIRGVIFDVMYECGIAIAGQADEISLNSRLETGQGKHCFITVALETSVDESVRRECESKLAMEVLQYLPDDVNCTASILECA